ncbi:unnamed protein product [Brugia pahangi]|uniref:Rad60-SLD domain-containing protein n=1 Tax=Brugia pahangi TaxID=6280 RepID=A0A0N4TVF4_BRUPA|nr:unnamed protein product [Brugia pahangi]
MLQNIGTVDTTTHPAIFLPSKNEMRYDESAIENAYRFISNISRKTLVKIDRNTRKYSVPMRKRSSFLLRSSMTKNNHKSAAKHWWIANEKKSKNSDVGLASSSISHHSLEFDDLFEIYSKQDKQGYKSGKVKKSSNLHNLLKVQSATDSANDFSSEMFKLRRKDLEFDEFIPQKESNSLESDSKRGKVQGTDETKRSKIALVLEMKLKISDKQVRCSAHTRIGDETIVVTCAGDYGDMESILKWTIDRKVEDGRELWVNDPIVDATNWDARRLQMISDISFGH